LFFVADFFKEEHESGSPWLGCDKKESIPRWSWMFLLLIAFAVLYAGTAIMPLLDRDEPRFARATVEMEQSGNYVVPYFNGQYRFDKPPLTYWWMRADYAIFGHNELGARMHSMVAAAAVALVILFMSRSFFGWRAGFWAAVAWLTLFQVWQHGRLAVADMPMVLFVATAHWAMWRLLTDDSPRKCGVWFWALWLSIALGFLAKGPVVFFCAILTLVIFRWVFWRKPIEWCRLQIPTGVVVALVPIAAWGIPALVETHGLYWKGGMEKHVVERGLFAFNDRLTIPVVFYLGTAFISLFPWMGRLGAGWAAARHCREDMRAAFLLSWAAGPYLIFAFYATQLPHYVLPAFPAIVMLMFARADGMSAKWAQKWFAWYHIVFCVLIVGMAVWFLFGPVYQPIKPMMLGFAGVLMGLQFTAVSFEFRKTLRIAMGLFMVVVASILAAYGMRKVALSPLAASYADSARGRAVAVGYTEPSLVYYSAREWEMHKGSTVELEKAIAEKPSVIVVLRNQMSMGALLGFKRKNVADTDYSRVAEEKLSSGYVRSDAEGLNIGRFSWVSVDIYLSIDQLIQGGNK
jgi:4-amino-4-deoxy-L-arabinose transferase-like glycosyltransferase